MRHLSITLQITYRVFKLELSLSCHIHVAELLLGAAFVSYDVISKRRTRQTAGSSFVVVEVQPFYNTAVLFPNNVGCKFSLLELNKISDIDCRTDSLHILVGVNKRPLALSSFVSAFPHHLPEQS